MRLTSTDPINSRIDQQIPCVTGHHWLIDLSGCEPSSTILKDAKTLKRLLPQTARKAGMTVVGQAFHQFMPSGVTGAVILSESHLTVHTWPESKFVAVDVYVCDFSADNFSKGQILADELVRVFCASSVNCQMVRRQSSSLERIFHGAPR